MNTSTKTQTDAIEAPSAAAFPDWPAGWYVAARSSEVGRKPLGLNLFGKRIVCFRTRNGSPVAMDARCWHMGADLSGGTLEGDAIQCPFHGWRFGADGRCQLVPAQEEVPACASQRTLAIEENASRVFVFLPGCQSYPLPFFAGVTCDELVAAPPFELQVACPWWLVGTNGFDLQHFAGAHDRRLVGPPVVTSPHPAARRIVANFEVRGTSWRDRLTRRFAGSHVTMDVTMWSGTLAFVIATFRDGGPDGLARRASFGMTEIIPRDGAADSNSLVRVTLFVRRHGPLDPIHARIRSNFVRAFLEPDVRVLDGASYCPERLIAADTTLAEYLRWLASISCGTPSKEEIS